MFPGCPRIYQEDGKNSRGRDTKDAAASAHTPHFPISTSLLFVAEIAEHNVVYHPDEE
jgi:hypothetical protein